MLRSWQESLDAPPWDGPEVWLHGDLMPGNLLVVNGRLSAVIDFGCLNVGDPACDLQPAWNLFHGASRLGFRAELAVDDASWLRGRGWALFQAVMALPYYRDTNPGMVRPGVVLTGAGPRRLSRSRSLRCNHSVQ
jgi:aminoglycoside phosphotransferase (APT) family kinase protein